MANINFKNILLSLLLIFIIVVGFFVLVNYFYGNSSYSKKLPAGYGLGNNPLPFPELTLEDKKCGTDSDCYLISDTCTSSSCHSEAEVKVNTYGLRKISDWRKSCESEIFITCVPRGQVLVPACIEGTCQDKIVSKR